MLRRKLAEAANFGVGRQTQQIKLNEDGSIFMSNKIAGIFGNEMTLLPDGVQREVTYQAPFGKKTVLVQVWRAARSVGRACRCVHGPAG